MTWAPCPHGVRTRGKKRVPRSRNDQIPPQAFSFCTEIRHALVENAVKIVAAANRPLARHSRQPIAWRFQQVSSATCSGGPRLQELRHPFSSVSHYRRFPLHHPCFTLRDMLLQVVRNSEQHSNKEKVQHGEGHMPSPMLLTNVSNSISPHGSEFCRQMQMIYGEKTF